MGDDRLVSVTSVPNRLNDGDQVVDSRPSSNLATAKQASEVEDDGRKYEEWAIERIRLSPLLNLCDSIDGISSLDNENHRREAAAERHPTNLKLIDNSLEHQLKSSINGIREKEDECH